MLEGSYARARQCSVDVAAVDVSDVAVAELAVGQQLWFEQSVKN